MKIQLFEDFVEENLRSHEPAFEPILDEVRGSFEHPSKEISASIKDAIVKGYAFKESQLVYEVCFKVHGDFTLDIEIYSNNDFPSDAGGMYFDDSDKSGTLRVTVNFTDMYKNLGRKNVKVDPVKLDSLMNSLEHELTHNIQHARGGKMYKILVTHQQARKEHVKHIYTNEVGSVMGDDDAKSQLAYMVYYFFNDVEMEAHQSSSAHMNALEELDFLKTCYENVLVWVKYYEMHFSNTKFKWPKSESVDKIISEFEETAKSSTLSNKFEQDSKDIVKYIPTIMKKHYATWYRDVPPKNPFLFNFFLLDTLGAGGIIEMLSVFFVL